MNAQTIALLALGGSLGSLLTTACQLGAGAVADARAGRRAARADTPQTRTVLPVDETARSRRGQ